MFERFNAELDPDLVVRDKRGVLLIELNAGDKRRLGLEDIEFETCTLLPGGYADLINLFK